MIGTLAAMADKDGLLDSPDHPVLDFFADRSVADLDDGKKAITVQHLLDMTSGIDWPEPLDGRPYFLSKWSAARLDQIRP